jgi:hypothetical protein
MNPEEKFLIDIGLLAVINVIWVKWSGQQWRAELGAPSQEEHFSCLNDSRNSP